MPLTLDVQTAMQSDELSHLTPTQKRQYHQVLSAFAQAIVDFCLQLMTKVLAEKVYSNPRFFVLPPQATLMDWTLEFVHEVLPKHLQEINGLAEQPTIFTIFDFGDLEPMLFERLEKQPPQTAGVLTNLVHLCSLYHLEQVSERLNLAGIASDLLDGLLSELADVTLSFNQL